VTQGADACLARATHPNGARRWPVRNTPRGFAGLAQVASAAPGQEPSQLPQARAKLSPVGASTCAAQPLRVKPIQRFELLCSGVSWAARAGVVDERGSWARRLPMHHPGHLLQSVAPPRAVPGVASRLAQPTWRRAQSVVMPCQLDRGHHHHPPHAREAIETRARCPPPARRDRHSSLPAPAARGERDHPGCAIG